ncbi:hypothetical protein, partial [Leuconostoc citreum]|uniref:hypothetical protein n=1 Tax=Leuconostoc citreum TaxID=33964 RepID=UPI0021A89F61
RFILVVLDDQLQHHKKKLNALKHLTSGRKKHSRPCFWRGASQGGVLKFYECRNLKFFKGAF